MCILIYDIDLFPINHWDPNIVAISGALFTLSLNKLELHFQYKEGARDDNNIWVPENIL